MTQQINSRKRKQKEFIGLGLYIKRVKGDVKNGSTLEVNRNQNLVRLVIGTKVRKRGKHKNDEFLQNEFGKIAARAV